MDRTRGRGNGSREHFGAQRYASGKVASYPQVRAVTLTAIPTHLVADITCGAYDTNEMMYAQDLLPQIPDDSLTASPLTSPPVMSAAGRSKPVIGN